MPLFWLSLAFIAGILLSARIQLSANAWLIMMGVSLVLAVILPLLRTRITTLQDQSSWWHSLPSFPYLLIACLFSLGAARYQLDQPDLTDPQNIPYYNDTGVQVSVIGWVIKPPVYEEGWIKLRLRVEGIQRPGEAGFLPVGGLIEARLWENGTLHYGDRILVEGELESPPEFEDFSYREYLARQGVYSYIQNGRVYQVSSGGGNPLLRVIYGYKEHALATVYRLWPDPEASLLAGILLGEESGIDDQVYQDFRDTGTAHIIVISGFNVTIIVGLLVGVFGRLLGRGQFGIRRGAIVAVAGIVVYTILVGAEAAVVRAAIMGGIALFASLVGRRQAGLNTLAFVAAAMAAFNPDILRDVGFQLSFAATLGLVLYAEPLKNAFERYASHFVSVETAQKLSRPVGEYLLYTLAAQVLVLPIIIYYFRRVSLTSLVANPLVLPAQPPVMVLGGLALLVGTIYYPLGQLLAWLAWPFVVYTIRVVELLANFPGGVLNLGNVSGVIVIIFYGVLFAMTFAWAHSKRIASRITPGLALAGLSVLAVLVWRVVMVTPDGRLHMTFLNVGTGDAVLIQTPTGRYVLIDGGPSTKLLSDALGRRLPFGQRNLDWLVVAGSGKEQIGGLPSNLERFPPEDVLWAGPTGGSYPARDMQTKLAELDLSPTAAETGQVLDLGDMATMRVLAVGRRGAVLQLEWRNFRALLPVGLDFEILERLQTDGELREISALLLADSGYAPVNPKDWIGHLHPQAVLLSVAAGDLQGLPSPETLEAIEGYNLLRTDRNGWIELTTDGDQLWIEVEKR